MDELGRTTELRFDELDRVIAQVLPDPDGEGPDGIPVTTFEYDAANNLIEVTDVLGKVTRMQYDARNRQTVRIDPDPDGTGPLSSPVTTWDYDAGNRLREMTDPLGRSTTYEYDDLDRLTLMRLADPDGAGPLSEPVFEYEYDAEDNLIASIDSLGNRTEYRYDALYRRTRIIESDPDGDGDLLAPETEYVFDAEDQLIAVIDPLGRTTTYQYDRLGRRIQMTRPDPDQSGPLSSPVMTYRYDGVGNELAMVDALGNETTYQFDKNYRVVKIVEPDPDGIGQAKSPVTRFEYDAADQLLAVTDALNRRTDYRYDQLGRIVEMALPDPDRAGEIERSVFRTKYDLFGNVIARTDALGVETRYVYDDLYRLKQLVEADPDGPGPEGNAVTEYEYDVASQLVTMIDPIGRTTRFVYDQLGRTIQEIHPDPDGAGPEGIPVVRLEYDAMGNLIRRTDQLGYQTQYEYDHLYRLKTVIEEDPDGAGPESNPVSRFEYDVASQMTASVDPLGRRTSMEYDDLGRIIQTTLPDPDAEGPLTSPEFIYVYDAMNNQTSVIDALGNETQFEYDNLYRRIQTTEADPDGDGPESNRVTQLFYDSEDQIVSIVDPLNRTSSIVYDDMGRVTRRVEPDPDGDGELLAPVTTYEYDLMSNQIRVVDALGLEQVREFDDLYRVIRILDEDPDGAGPLERPVTSMRYDLAGQLIQFTDPLDRTTTYDFDDLGRVTEVIQPDPDGDGVEISPVILNSYDLYGNLIAKTDPNGNTTEFEYDQLHRLIEERGADLDGDGPKGQPTTQYRYDVKGNLILLTDTAGNDTTYEYDELDRQILETIELGVGNLQSRRYEYDSMNNLIRKTDRNERVTEYEFDNLYRQTEERWVANDATVINTIRMTYDIADQWLTGQDESNNTLQQFEYDQLGRLKRTVADYGGPIVELNSTYDANHRLLTRSAAIDGVADFENRYEYDGLNRLTLATQSGVLGGSNVTNKRVELTYNIASQLDGIRRFSDLAGSSLVATTSHEFDGIGRLKTIEHQGIVNYGYDFDPGSRIVRVTNSVDGESVFDYDAIDQLTSEQHTFQNNRAYPVDELGNRESENGELGLYNRVLSDGVFEYEYDDEGNRIRRTNISDGTVTEYVWDYRNRLTSVIERTSLTGDVVARVDHRYNVFNQWISKSVDGDGAGIAVTTDYFYAGDQIVLELGDDDSVTHRYFWGPGQDQLLVDEDVISAENRWALVDHQNTVRDWVDDSGNVTNHITYDAFGNVTEVSNSEFESLIGFTGRPLEKASGLQNNLHRWYESTTGRWVSEDPISFFGGDANLYRYVGNDPVGQIDPSGRMKEDPFYRFLGEKLYEAQQNGAQSYRNYRALTVGLDPLRSGFSKTMNQLGTSVNQFGQTVNMIPVITSGLVEHGKYWTTGQANSPYADPTSDLRGYLKVFGKDQLRKKLQRGYDYGRLAKAAYDIQEGQSVGAYKAIKTVDDYKTGFRAVVFKNIKTCKYVLSFAGTDTGPNKDQSFALDWGTDFYQGGGGISSQYRQAIALTNTLKKVLGDKLSLTGHSLGGGLAAAASMVHNLQAKTFNSAGVHELTLKDYGANMRRQRQLIESFRLDGDPLTTVQYFMGGAAPATNGVLMTIPNDQRRTISVAKYHGMGPFLDAFAGLLKIENTSIDEVAN